MDTGKIIEGIETRMFDPSYFSALKTSYSDQVILKRKNKNMLRALNS